MSNTITQADLYNDYLTAFRALHPCDARDLRRCARIELLSRGDREINSGDVDNLVYTWFKLYESFSQEVIDGLRDYYLDEVNCLD